MTELENYVKEKLTIDIVKVNIYGAIASIPLTIIYAIPFYLIWKERFTIGYLKKVLSNIDMVGNEIYIAILIFLVFFLGIVLHELIHGITWSLYTKNGFKSIKFGVLLKMLTPYCHCNEPLKVKYYITGAIMPAIVLGIIPSILSIIFGNIFLLIIGHFFTGAALGDFMIINLLRKENGSSMVLDHPSEAGCYIFRAK